jgi:predicted metalloprotease with PDZ domain
MIRAGHRTCRSASNWIDDNGGFFNCGSVLFYSPAHLESAISLKLTLPASWRIATPLADRGGLFVAANYRQLIDSPVQFGDFEERDMTVVNTHWRLIFDAQVPPYDVKAFDENLRRIIATEMQMFGDPPFREFTVLFHWRPDLEYGGGMEFGKAMIVNIGKEWMESRSSGIRSEPCEGQSESRTTG